MEEGEITYCQEGFYGDRLTKCNLSLEHLKAKSKGGATTLDNLVLASREKNCLRGNDDIRNFFNKKFAMNYLSQFMGVKTKKFNGDKYIASIIKTLGELGIEL